MNMFYQAYTVFNNIKEQFNPAIICSWLRFTCGKLFEWERREHDFSWCGRDSLSNGGDNFLFFPQHIHTYMNIVHIIMCNSRTHASSGTLCCETLSALSSAHAKKTHAKGRNLIKHPIRPPLAPARTLWWWWLLPGPRPPLPPLSTIACIFLKLRRRRRRHCRHMLETRAHKFFESFVFAKGCKEMHTPKTLLNRISV